MFCNKVWPSQPAEQQPNPQDPILSFQADEVGD